MAGQPRTRALRAAIRKTGGYGRILDEVSKGTTLTRLAEELGGTRAMLSRVMEKHSPERFAAAKKAAAGSLVDKATEIIETVPADKEEIQKARLKTDHYRWHAGVLDREVYGEQKAAAVNVNVLGLAHLEELKARKPLPTQRVAIPAGA